MKKKFDSKPVYGDSGKHIKTKIKSYSDIVNTNFQDKRISKKKKKKLIRQMFAIDNVRFCCQSK